MSDAKRGGEPSHVSAVIPQVIGAPCPVCGNLPHVTGSPDGATGVVYWIAECRGDTHRVEVWSKDRDETLRLWNAYWEAAAA